MSDKLVKKEEDNLPNKKKNTFTCKYLTLIVLFILYVVFIYFTLKVNFGCQEQTIFVLVMSLYKYNLFI